MNGPSSFSLTTFPWGSSGILGDDIYTSYYINHIFRPNICYYYLMNVEFQKFKNSKKKKFNIKFLHLLENLIVQPALVF